MEKEGNLLFIYTVYMLRQSTTHLAKTISHLALCMIALVSYIPFLDIYSIGCGIGYGYLHRIPLRDEAHRPKEAPVITPAPDGFSEVKYFAMYLIQYVFRIFYKH